MRRLQNPPAGGLVGQFKDFVLPEKGHLMLAGNGAAPQGMDTDLPLFPGAAEAFPAVDRLQGMLGIQGLHQELGGAAGGVGLAVVVGLGDLHIPAGQGGGGKDLQKPLAYGNAQGIVGAIEDGRIGCQGLQGIHILGRIGRDPGKIGGAGTAHIGGGSLQGAGAGKIQRHVPPGQGGQGIQVVHIHPGQGGMAGGLRQLPQHGAHTAPSDQH